jgi:hypothetical protein
MVMSVRVALWPSSVCKLFGPETPYSTFIPCILLAVWSLTSATRVRLVSSYRLSSCHRRQICGTPRSRSGFAGRFHLSCILDRVTLSSETFFEPPFSLAPRRLSPLGLVQRLFSFPWWFSRPYVAAPAAVSLRPTEFDGVFE